MKTIATLCAVATALSSFSGIALARDHRDDADERRVERQERREARRDARQERREARVESRVETRVHPGLARGERYVYQQPAPARRSTYVVRTEPSYHYGSTYTYGSGYVQAPNYYYPAQTYSYGYSRPAYAVGGYVPYSYRQPTYYVNDWQSYHNLYAPPYGHQWVRTDTGDFLLMAIATGIIASLILNR